MVSSRKNGEFIESDSHPKLCLIFYIKSTRKYGFVISLFDVNYMIIDKKKPEMTVKNTIRSNAIHSNQYPI